MSWADDKHKVLAAVFIILRRDGQVLFIRRFNTGHMDGQYGWPSGHVEDNVPAILAAVREAKEEVGVTIDPADLTLRHTRHRVAEEGVWQYIDFYFETTRWKGKPHNAEPDKCDDVRWFKETELPDNVIPYVRECLGHINDGTTYSHGGF